MTDLTIKTQNKKIYGPYDLHITSSICCDAAEDKTKQSFGQQCDINHIMKMYEKTGLIEGGNATPPQYGEVSAFDFQTAQNIVIQANQMFDQLPSAIRSKFDNDPQTMLAFMDNPKNKAEAEQLGLLPPPEASQEAQSATQAGITSSDVKTSLAAS